MKENSYVSEMQIYWNNRFSGEDMIWGNNPSKTAQYALEIFSNNNVKSIFIPGIGYGRNSRLFSSGGFDVSGVDISEKSIEIGKEFDAKSNFYKGCILDIPISEEKYDAIYCFNVLHLFKQVERELFINRCLNIVNKGGLLFFTVFSEKESSFGNGTEVEKNTFESKPGRPVHYFTQEDLASHFKQCKIIDTNLVDDFENHGEGSHVHRLRYICAVK